MDITQLDKDAASSRPKTPTAARPPRTHESSEGTAESLWLGTSEDVSYSPPVRQVVTQRVHEQSRIEPTLDEMPAAAMPRVEIVERASQDTGNFPEARARARRQQGGGAVPMSAPPQSRPMNVPQNAPTAVEEAQQTVRTETAEAKPLPEETQVETKEEAPVRPEKPTWRERLGSYIKRERAKSAAKKAELKQKEQDEKNKKASVKKRNFSRYIGVMVMVLVALFWMYMRHLTAVEQKAGVSEASAPGPNAKALDDATALLNGAETPHRPTAPTSAAGASDLAPEKSQMPQASSGGTSDFSPPPPPSASEDPYITKMKQLKGELNANGNVGTSASRLPNEIANEPLPRGAGARSQSRTPQYVPPRQIEPPAPVPDDIESNDAKPAQARDPLERVAVVGRMHVENNGTVPYAIGQLRYAQEDSAVYLFAKNSDPLITGRWYQVGDQTDAGWTVVQITASSVNIVSPRGRVYQIN